MNPYSRYPSGACAARALHLQLHVQPDSAIPQTQGWRTATAPNSLPRCEIVATSFRPGARRPLWHSSCASKRQTVDARAERV
eukprot:980275-Prymnesium_polylepis.1